MWNLFIFLAFYGNCVLYVFNEYVVFVKIKVVVFYKRIIVDKIYEF